MRKSPTQVTRDPRPAASRRRVDAVAGGRLEAERQSTGFKGYHLFRKTRLALSKKAPEIGQKVLDELLPEMGGD